MTNKVKWSKEKEIKRVGGQLSLNTEKCFIRYHTVRQYETCYNVSTDNFNKICYRLYINIGLETTQCVQVLLGLCSLKIQDVNYFQNFTLFFHNSVLLNHYIGVIDLKVFEKSHCTPFV
jgi:hypothetical protein